MTPPQFLQHLQVRGGGEGTEKRGVSHFSSCTCQCWAALSGPRAVGSGSSKGVGLGGPLEASGNAAALESMQTYVETPGLHSSLGTERETGPAETAVLPTYGLTLQANWVGERGRRDSSQPLADGSCRARPGTALSHIHLINFEVTFC